MTQRLAKEKGMLARRDELVEEFKESSEAYKRKKVDETLGISMIG